MVEDSCVLRNVTPARPLQHGAAALPKFEPIVMRPNHRPDTARLCRKSWISEYAPNKQRGLFRRDIQKHQAIGRMAKPAIEELLIPREERALLETVQQR